MQHIVSFIANNFFVYLHPGNICVRLDKIYSRFGVILNLVCVELTRQSPFPFAVASSSRCWDSHRLPSCPRSPDHVPSSLLLSPSGYLLNLGSGPGFRIRCSSDFLSLHAVGGGHRDHERPQLVVRLSSIVSSIVSPPSFSSDFPHCRTSGTGTARTLVL